MLVRNPRRTPVDLSYCCHNDLDKLLWLCINDLHPDLEKDNIPFWKKINNASLAIQKNFEVLEKDYARFLSWIANCKLYYNREDQEFWRDLYLYVVGDKILEVVDDYKKETYSLFPAGTPPIKEIKPWKDIRKLPNFGQAK